LAYAGAVVNSQYKPIDLGRIMNDLPSDVEAIRDIRQTAVNWGLVTSTSDTRSLSDEGYALAQRLVEENQDLIYQLAEDLREVRSMDREALEAWFAEHTVGEGDDGV
jgi:hypothetical protein